MDFPTREDGLKWFGEGFDGFPKRLPEDCVEYAIYIIDEQLRTSAALRARLEEIIRAVAEMKKSMLKDYIWQREGFELNVYPKLAPHEPIEKFQRHVTDPLHLRGRTNFGDSSADEWLIVFVLLEISKRFHDAWIRTFDTDGEFLLIEAAKSLPKWLNPEIAENRVWLNDGRLKVIPLEDNSTSRNLSLQKSLEVLKCSPSTLVVEPTINSEAFFRLREYPSAISSSFHHTLVTIPRKLAYVLHYNAAYVSPAIEAFYLRDVVALKPLSTKDTATLAFPPEDFVTVSVKFTKVGFAQLKSQLFDVPPAWTGIIPRLKDEKVMLGLKLTCGFEMLVADVQNRDKRAVREINILLAEVEDGEDQLPDDGEVATWPRTLDDEKWLDIDYNDLNEELSGGGRENGGSFGDRDAQENLRKMVDRFQEFIKDDEAGAEGIDDPEDSSEPSTDDDNETFEAAEDEEAAFEEAMKAAHSMSALHVEQSGLLDEARRLALEDDDGNSEVDEDEEVRKVMELVEKELQAHGARKSNEGRGKKKAPVATHPESGGTERPFFGPERPPAAENALATRKGQSNGADEEEEEVGPGDGELSSDDEDFNDVDLDLAKNMLESFKGQAGMSGPAGNLMKALGVGMPRDESDD